MADSDSPRLAWCAGAADAYVTAGVETVIRASGIEESVRCGLHGPALDVAGRVQASCGVCVETAFGGTPQVSARLDHAAKVG
jgi:hypothetical protein